MGHRDSVYRLHDLVEIDDALVGSQKPGKRGRGAEGKVPVLVAVENRDSGAGFMAMQPPGVSQRVLLPLQPPRLGTRTPHAPAQRLPDTLSGQTENGLETRN